MDRNRLSLALTFALGMLAVAPPAIADVAPIDLCDEQGESCDNAGGQGTGPGICTMSRCTRAVPPGMGEGAGAGVGAGGDGGSGIIVYDCLRCLSTGGTGNGGEHAAGNGGEQAAGNGGEHAAGNGGTQAGASMGGVSEGGAGMASGGNGASGGAAGSGSQDGGDGCDCVLGPRASERAVVGLILLVGLGALAWARRTPRAR